MMQQQQPMATYPPQQQQPMGYPVAMQPMGQPLLAPGEMSMDRLLQGEGVMLKQFTSECCLCLCCQPNIHWTLHPYKKADGMAVDFDEVNQSRVWIQEDAGWCGRTWSWCAPGFRATTYRTINSAVPDQNAPISATSELTHKKSQTCGQNVIVACTDNGPIRCPCCCCLPYMDTLDKNGQMIGKTKYICDMCLCVPKFMVEDANGQAWYRIRSDTCCCGMCVRCKCGEEKGKCCHVPFYIRDPHTHEPIEDAQIVDLWAGFKHECCTRKNVYGIKFPSNATPQQKATLIGAALLLDITIVEQEE